MLLIKRLTGDAKMPIYGSANAIGADLFSTHDETVMPGMVSRVATGIALAIPNGYYGRIAPRSGLSTEGIDVLAGVIDPDYRGEVVVLLTTHGKIPKFLPKGAKIAQLILERADQLAIVDVGAQDLDATARGAAGFGSTGL